MNILKIHMMKPGHRSEDDSAGYVCSNAILGHLKRGGGKKKKSLCLFYRRIHALMRPFEIH